MRNSSTNYFYEDDPTGPVISDDNHYIWPVSIRIDQLSIFMTYLQLAEFMIQLNTSYESYLRGPNYGKQL